MDDLRIADIVKMLNSCTLQKLILVWVTAETQWMGILFTSHCSSIGCREQQKWTAYQQQHQLLWVVVLSSSMDAADEWILHIAIESVQSNPQAIVLELSTWNGGWTNDRNITIKTIHEGATRHELVDKKLLLGLITEPQQPYQVLMPYSW